MSDNYGIPAFLPVQTDTVVTEAVAGSFVETCVTATLRAVAYTNSDNTTLTVAMYRRDTGYIIEKTPYALGSAVRVLRVVPCGTVPLVVYLRADGLIEYITWNGSQWTAEETISSIGVALDATATPNGCHVLWSESGPPEVLFAGQFIDGKPTSSHYDFGTGLDTDTDVVFKAVAIDAAPNGELFVAWASTTDVSTATYSSSADRLSQVHAVYNDPSAAGFLEGLTIVARGLRNSEGHYPFVITVKPAVDVVIMFELESTNPALTGYTFLDRRNEKFYRSAMESRAFRVGDEVFVWLRSLNSMTRFLVAGVTRAQRCGISDREESLVRYDGSHQVSLAGVERDYANDGKFTWARKIESGQTYSHTGNARIGDINFLPRLSTAKFGKSVYLAGSMVRNWDGEELGDAGFQDYPIVASATPSAAGGILATGAYLIRTYVVRYNKQGERFQSVTVTTSPVNVTGPTGSIDLLINPIVATNHGDCQIEVYLTQADGDTFYLAATVANTLEAETIALSLTGADPGAIIIDPHGPDVGQELEESGPTGCEIIMNSADRLWSIGGQIPPGQVHFSKRVEPGEGAGWDAIAGFIVMDATGHPLTSLAAFGDFTVVGFQENSVYQVMGPGPSNLISAEQFDAPRCTIVDGATSHWGTISLPIGIAYWGKNGPRLLTPGGGVIPIAQRVEPLASTLTPSGVRADLAKREIVWYTEGGIGLLWNYAYENSRWAKWTNLPVAGLSDRLLVTTDGRVLTAAKSTPKDDGRRFAFRFGTGLIRPEALLQDYTKIRSVGISGEYLGPHRVRFEVYYDGNPMWSETFRWDPSDKTWLNDYTDYDNLTTEEIDALDTRDMSAQYSTHRRVERQTCKYLRVVVSDCTDRGFTPWELSFELGSMPGMGRTPINKFD